MVLTAVLSRLEPRNVRETDQPFPEPALFLLNPDGEVVIIDYSNSPFARPDLRILVEGMLLTTRHHVIFVSCTSTRPSVCSKSKQKWSHSSHRRMLRSGIIMIRCQAIDSDCLRRPLVFAHWDSELIGSQATIILLQLLARSTVE